MTEVDNNPELGLLALKKDHVHFFLNDVERSDVILTLAGLLEDLGYVKDTFAQAVIDREKIFPTGLPTEPYGIAIPHTDAEHVNRGALAVGILEEPVKFVELGSSEDQTVDAHIVVMMAIPDPKAVVVFLGKLAGLFQDVDFLTALQKAKIPEDVVDIFKRKMPAVISEF